jgi:alcohol dehydrogenase class IV
VTGFDLALPRRVLFGPGRAAELPGLLPALGRRVLLCTGRDPSRSAHLLGDLDPAAVVTVPHEPTVDDVRAATDRGRTAEVDVVVAIGGGSVLDLGKAVAVLLGNAEATANASLRSPEHGLKASIRSPHMLPAVALVDPLLTVSCPPAVTASSGLDALTQCLEPYVSPRANPATDALAADGLRRGAGALRTAYEHGDDPEAREQMALCSLFGGIALAGAKLGAVHGLAGVIGGMIDAPHGTICAALLAPTFEANLTALRERAPASPALRRHDDVARLLTGRDDARADDALPWLRETVAALHVRPLGALGLQAAQHAEVAAKAARSSSMQGNPVALSQDVLVGVLESAS